MERFRAPAVRIHTIKKQKPELQAPQIVQFRLSKEMGDSLSTITPKPRSASPDQTVPDLTAPRCGYFVSPATSINGAVARLI
jgi:hypothetical protein